VIPLVTSHFAALALVVADAVIRGFRMRLLFPKDERPALGVAIGVNAYGDAASALTPARLGGDVARFVGIRSAGVSASSALAGLAVERLVDYVILGASILIIGIGFTGTLAAGAAKLAREARSPLGLALIGVVVVLAAVSLIIVKRRFQGSPSKFKESLRGIGGKIKAMPRGRVAGIGGLAVLSVATRTAVLPVLTLAYTTVNLTSVTIGSFALLYGQMVIPTPAGAGGVELGFIGGFQGTLGASELAALLISWRFYTLLTGPVAAGVLTVMQGRKLFRSKKRGVGGAGIGLLLVPLLAQSLVAQGPRLLPTDHWANEYVGLLTERGVISGISPLTQPYTRSGVARAIGTLDADTLEEPVAGWVRLLQEEFTAEPGESPAWGAYVEARGRGATSRRLDPLRPTGNENIWGWGGGGAWAATGGAVGEVRIIGDTYWKDDPDGLHPGQRLGGRTDFAYLALDVPGGWLAVGRLRQNWFLPGRNGLMISDEAFSYPQLTWSLGLGPLSVRSLLGELETIGGDKRYLAAHRFDVTRPSFAVSLGESIIFQPAAGGLSLRYLNPLEVFLVDRDTEPRDQAVNVMLNAQVWARIGRFTVFGEGMLDDIDINRRSGDGEPLIYAFTVGARMTMPAPWLIVGTSYQQVSAWAYRTPNVTDRYSFLERGLGDNFSDYDQFTLTADVWPAIPGLRLSPTLQLQRRGEGDFRDSIPPTAEYFASPNIFLGTRERTLRFGLGGRYQPLRFFWVAWDVGENFVRNKNHVAGASTTEFQAVAEVGVRIDFPLR
jgi:uncharacterized membrane protein YbhN (UPF0104 family)